jgi:signal transduction histidine kinase
MPTPDRDPIDIFLPTHRRRWLIAGIVVLAGAAFIADLSSDRLLAFGIAYIPLICSTAFHRDPRVVWWVTGATLVMVAIGYFLPTVNVDVPASLMNRALSVVAIVITAVLVRYERYVRDRLVEQRRHAQTAERTKSQLLSNLSHELRTPLNAILGFSDLLLADCRPDQQGALRHINAGGKRLLRTLENLIELSHFDDQRLRPQEVDVTRLLRQLTDAAGAEAAEQQITLQYKSGPERIATTADHAAVRRIVDNLLANAIKFTGPGGTIEVMAESTADGITTIVRDSGIGMPSHVLAQLGAPFFQGETGTARRFEGLGTGLALSLRLATIMGAKLTFDSVPNKGTTARLWLPAQPAAASPQASR